MIYMGSKSRIAKYILPIILKNRTINQYYVEPFCGGCNMIDKVSGNRIASDNNKYLIAMFNALVYRMYEYPKNIITKETYSFARDCYNKNNGCIPDYEIGWIGFMGSYNGRFFDGGYSGHDVKGRDYIREQIKNTMKSIDKLNGVHFIFADYKDLIIPPNSIIYCDIPYKGTKQYSTSINFDYDFFYKWCIKKKKEGHTIFISEYDMPNIFECIWEMPIKNSMNTNKTYMRTEKLFIPK